MTLKAEFLGERSEKMRPLSVDSFHTVLFCRKWDACVQFYRDILEFIPVDEKPGFVEFQVVPGSHIGLLKYVGKHVSKNNASFILSFRVENLEEFHKSLSARCEGVTAVKQHPWGARIFELRDPEERRLEFWTPL
jgi:catechol 2,3-dioxygenase-like lactoylglutathione lyase family enzyme